MTCCFLIKLLVVIKVTGNLSRVTSYFPAVIPQRKVFDSGLARVKFVYSHFIFPGWNFISNVSGLPVPLQAWGGRWPCCLPDISRN